MAAFGDTAHTSSRQPPKHSTAGRRSTMNAALHALETRLLFTKYGLTELGFIGSAGPSSAYGFVENDFAINGTNIVGIRQRQVGGTQVPFISSAKKFKPSYLQVSPSFFRSAPNAVNSAGVAVGFGERSDTTADEALLWKKGKETVLGPGFANGINSAGEVVGTDDASGIPIPVIFG